ncbi:MAG: hypothetical protein Fur0037_01580 [Planctomycetota bacterium]
MNRPQVLVLSTVLCAVAAAAVLLFWGHDRPMPTPAPAPAAVDAPENAFGTASQAAEAAPRNATVKRQEVSLPASTRQEDDPEIRAALCGFKGRVVDARKNPVAGTGVRIYRFAADSLFRPDMDFMKDGSFEPDYVAGETTTGPGGEFAITGVWPRAIYLMLAGIGSDAPTHQVLQRYPGPGEIVDIGDVVLEDAAVVTGAIVDEDGNPVEGALVRGADLPGQLAGVFPLERFDPEGVVILREMGRGGFPVPVVEMPKWVKSAFERMPIPNTRTDKEGRFRLVGLVPGSNMIAATKEGMLARLVPTVMLHAAEEKDLGTLRMSRGEELVGKVIDSRGEPVAGAEVVAGGTISMIPFDFASRIGRTDENGEFDSFGFPKGNVTVGARRGNGQPWVIAKPQRIDGTITVTLPAQYSVTVIVTGHDGARVEHPDLRLFSGAKDGGEGLLEIAMMGLARPVDLEGRLHALEDGRLRIDGLDAGSYRLLAATADSAVGDTTFELDADKEIALQIPARIAYTVQVVGPQGEGIRGATIYIEQRGEDVQIRMPMCCGRTDSLGRLEITQARSDRIRVSAEHPRWGSVHGEVAKEQGSLVLRMETPGSIEGRILEGSRPAPAGKYAIAVTRQYGNRGAIEDAPILVANGVDGAFALKALQPSKYALQPIKSLDALRSPGAIYELARNAWFEETLSVTTVDVEPGRVARVEIDATPKEIEGPTAHVYGTVMIDGRPGTDCTVMCWAGRRAGARCDERGRFDLGRVQAGTVQLNVSFANGVLGGPDGRYSLGIELKEGEEREVLIDIQTGGISGHVLLPDGSPAAGASIGVSGDPLGPDGQPMEQGSSWVWTRADEHGAFAVDKLPVGDYRLDARDPEDRGKASVPDIRLRPGQPVVGLQIRMDRTVVVKGRVDYSALARKPDWSWIQFMARKDPNDATSDFTRPVNSTGCDGKGEFETTDLRPGTYRVEIYVSGQGSELKRYRHQGLVTVPPQGLENLLLIPVPVEEPRAGGR